MRLRVMRIESYGLVELLDGFFPVFESDTSLGKRDASGNVIGPVSDGTPQEHNGLFVSAVLLQQVSIKERRFLVGRVKGHCLLKFLEGLFDPSDLLEMKSIFEVRS